mmetsp:Transcript_103410/g.299135  ORF Transcript_103410/g.299135 Transcript_103410/m.299135 type:complete len:387 (-) Transcript_103410:175-1335(-)
METAEEPMRRRLTVGPGMGSSFGAAVASGEAGGADSSEAMAELLSRYATSGRAYCVTSKSDRLEHRKTEFGEKDQEARSSDGSLSDEEAVRAMLNSHPIAWKCHKGKKPEAPNQDSFSICIADQDFGLYCVYDGHGPFGHDVSDRARNLLVNEFLSRKDRSASLKEAFEESFTRTQSVFQDLTSGSQQPRSSKLDASMSGTTATMAYHDMRANKLWIAHVGDSRAVLGRAKPGSRPQIEDMTVDHKPDLEAERTRIEKNGGRVIFDGYYNHRVFAKAGAYPGLNMSRALGDCVGHKEAGLTAMPDVREVDLNEFDGEEVVLLLCTDGVWEFFSSEDAMMLMMARGEDRCLKTSLGEVTKKSWDKWMHDSDNEVSDDITGIAVVLKK